MPITATRTPAALSWANFTPVATLIDPADGGTMDAFTGFNWGMPGTTTTSGADTVFTTQVVTITPNCRVRIGAPQTAPLLAHEHLHYDVGFVIARQFAREATNLRAPDAASLIAKLRTLATFHFETRAGLIQRRYDIDTRHGTNAHYQAHYVKLMTGCLANPNATQIGGWML